MANRKVCIDKMEQLDVKDVNFLKRVLKDTLDFNGDLMEFNMSTDEPCKKGLSAIVAHEGNKKIQMTLIFDFVDENSKEDIVYNCDVFEDENSKEPTYRVMMILSYKSDFDRPYKEYLFRDEDGNVITYVFRVLEVNLNYYKEKYYNSEKV